MLYANTLLTISLLYIPDFVFKSWIFWMALIVMIIGILLWHNGFFGKRSNMKSTSKPPFSTSQNNSGQGISYSSEGRSGRVYYRNNGASFSLYYEFGGGNCVAWIDIPGIDKWEKITGLPLSSRDTVLKEIGQQVVKDQVSSGKGYFHIEGNALNIYESA